MSASTTATSSSTSVNTSVFWERLWRMSGINFVVFFIIAYVLYGHQPQVGASADALVAFYGGDRTRILIAAVVSGLAVLNLLWFAAALRTTLADAGQGGWGAAATASSAAVGGLFLLLITVGAALAYSIAGSTRRRSRPKVCAARSSSPTSGPTPASTGCARFPTSGPGPRNTRARGSS
jgi:hypothetical protein